MKPYRLHLFVCQGKNCSARGSEEILKTLRERLDKEGLKGEIKTSKSGCLSVCKETEPEGGFCPAMVIYPQGVWYRNLAEADVGEIVERYLKKGEVVERVLHFKLGL
ncbi:MAG: (2Fe-2S) ferredoxin domain-containing protein [Deltaproteobacteria bacterium]|nr:(2Fe-2S) ferredoxin domain-containing protein [Deltaproteobacteria bacterium]